MKFTIDFFIMGEYSGEIKTKKENNKISVGSTTMTALNITKI